MKKKPRTARHIFEAHLAVLRDQAKRNNVSLHGLIEAHMKAAQARRRATSYTAGLVGALESQAINDYEHFFYERLVDLLLSPKNPDRQRGGDIRGRQKTIESLSKLSKIWESEIKLLRSGKFPKTKLVSKDSGLTVEQIRNAKREEARRRRAK